ncbi:threonine aldolase family protein [Marinoscillum pacificum]|uniref:threonine aldolase family protein n=1 Tax=Marinoscillum pacificum TaxID=392723 RepID=UPI0021584844|nr:GntG family PLP-dependent aldolase [Marinoscillum pacificum]
MSIIGYFSLMIDLRSDTVTKPTPAMLEAMMSAEVGDDVFGADPTVNHLQQRLAEMFGMEDALYCPSGTMTNQIALRIASRPQDEVICDKRSHIYLYEGGGMAYNSMLSPKLLDGDRGRITAEMVAANINPPDDIHLPRTSIVGLENTMNKGGGCIYDINEIKAIRKVCDENGLHLHLDGARLFNALVETGESPSEYGELFDTISICFSKGLGAPVGSVLLGTADHIREAKRVRKVLGGGMRQVGYLAAACNYALDHHIDRLKEDHARARILGEEMAKKDFVEQVLPVETNIVISELVNFTPKQLLAKFEQLGLYAVAFGPQAVRFVTHLDFDDKQLEQAVDLIRRL